jgi:hypothetical protein
MADELPEVYDGFSVGGVCFACKQETTILSMWVCADQDYVDQDLTFRLSSRSGISCALLDRAIGSGADQADTQSLSKQTNSLGVDWCAGEWERAETGVRAGPFSCGNDLERASRRFATSGVEVYIMFGAVKKLDVRADVRSQAIVALPTHVRMVDSTWQRVVRRQTSLDFV